MKNQIRLRVALIARDNFNRVLLVNHLRPHVSYWVLPGGGVETGETLEENLKREIAEELGVDASIDKLVAVGELITPDRHVVDFFFQGAIEPATPFKIQHEEGIGDVVWAEPAQLEHMTVLPSEIVPLLKHGKAKVKRNDKAILYLGKYKV